jgi:hypothetical protein
MNSLFEINPAALDLFPEFIPWTRLSKRIEVAARKLDDLEEIQVLDYLKIDVQGGELSVFRSGRAKLADAVVVQTEVSFIQLYKGQPTFGEVDLELRRQGFVPHCLAEVQQRPISPHVVEDDPWATRNQVLEAGFRLRARLCSSRYDER